LKAASGNTHTSALNQTTTAYFQLKCTSDACPSALTCDYA